MPDSEVALEENETLAWLTLVLTPGLGPRRILAAVSAFGSPQAVLAQPMTRLGEAGFPASALKALSKRESHALAEKEWKAVEEQHAHLVTHSSDEYPDRLREIYDPPPVLWVRGDVKLLGRTQIAIVGTRHPTPYGTGMANLLARDLAARKMVITSGMARGVDTAAHKAALAAHGATVAVWGTGIDVVYPKENKSLAEQILMSGGAIVAEVPLGTFPATQNFPRRNRILSGMSVGVLVVEAGENSGTRITARCAQEQNRELYAVPGNATSRNSWTPNTLIKQGAKLTATWEDVWEDLPSQTRIELEEELAAGVSTQALADSAGQESASSSAAAGLAPHEAVVYSILRADEALQMDEIMQMAEDRLTSAEVFTALFELEMSGKIRALPGKNYVKSF